MPMRTVAGNRAGIDLIATERKEHGAKGWTAEHDDDHDGGALALAALAYVGHAAGQQVFIRSEQDLDSADPAITLDDPWPWDRKYDKRRHYAASNSPIDPTKLTTAQRIELLAIAGSLIAAEIDRLQRARVKAK